MTKVDAELIAVRQQRDFYANTHAQEAAARMMAEKELAEAKQKIEQLEDALSKALSAGPAANDPGLAEAA